MMQFEKPPSRQRDPQEEQPTRILRRPEIQFRIGPEILDGEKCDSLAGAMHSYESRAGDRIAAATDKGIGYKDHNEDRVVIIPGLSLDQSSYTVIDGMGGEEGGKLAAEILAEEIMAEPINIDVAVKNAKGRMMTEGVGVRGGACFLQVYIAKDKQGRRFLETAQAGDVRMIVIAKNSGRVIATTNDESFVEALVKENVITPDQAIYHNDRNKVTNVITARKGKPTEQFSAGKALPIYSEDRIVIFSDGISDNLTDDEILDLIKGKTPEDAIREISRVTDDRMSNAKEIIQESPNRAERGVYSDGYKSKPKPDNRSIVIIDIA